MVLKLCTLMEVQTMISRIFLLHGGQAGRHTTFNIDMDQLMMF